MPPKLAMFSMTRRRVGRRKICHGLFVCFILVSTTLYFLIGKIIPFSSSDEEVIPDDVMVILRDTRDQKEYIDKKGIHVIVGQYVGSNIDWELIKNGGQIGSINLTSNLVNQNNYHPQFKAGEMGMPVYVPSWEKERMKLLYHVNKFNLLASDRISINRSLPDPRKEACKKKIYDVHSLPTASIIIVFHNEAWSTLIRTVHSVLNRSPSKILKEVILVDDASERTFLKEELDQYITTLNSYSHVPVSIIRAGNRTGLIRARLLGAEIATGKVLVFLDAHCEATVGWLEPLLQRVHDDPKTVIAPVIDVIHDETFAYAKSFELHWGGFNWNLHFRWFPLGSSELQRRRMSSKETEPFITPIIAGGLFAIDRKFFYDMGSYDDQMDIWGGENLEMSLRIWMCGGRLEISPCSHVGHLFRKSSPYTFVSNRKSKKNAGSKGTKSANSDQSTSVASVLYGNLARVAEIWMDEYKEFFYTMNPVSRVPVDEESLEGRRTLRRQLGCKSFSWFLQNIWPENFLPADDRFFGQVQSVKTKECLQRPGHKTSVGGGPVGRLDLERCTIEPYPPQSFVYTKKGFLMSDDSVCLDVPVSDDDLDGSYVLMLACSELSRQKWRYNPSEKTMVHVNNAMCMTVDSSSLKKVILSPCREGDERQMWNLVSIPWKFPSLLKPVESRTSSSSSSLSIFPWYTKR